jgi:hypothetical protein
VISWRAKRQGLIGVSVAIVACSLWLGSAQAGTYVVDACKLANGSSAPWSGWSYSSVGPESFDAEYCDHGQYRILFMRARAAHSNGDHGQLTFTAPAGTSVVGYSIWRSVRLLGSTQSDYSYALLEGDPNVEVESCDGLGSACVSLGDYTKPPAPANLVQRRGLPGLGRFWLRLGCASPTGCQQLSGDSPAKLWLHRAEVVLEDAVPPQFSAPPTGSLLNTATPLAGVRDVAVAATDEGGGVRDVRVEIDGHQVADSELGDPATCREPYFLVVPCSRSASGVVAVDTSHLADGDHTLRLAVTDATGTNTASWGPVTITTENECRPNNRIRSLRLNAALVTKRGPRRSLTTHFGRRLAVRGELLTSAGQPVAGALICIGARDSRGQGPLKPYEWVQTDADGAFSSKVPAGPSRRIFAIHPTPAGAAVASLTVRVRAAVTLHPSSHRLRNGDVLHLGGRIRGGPFRRPPLVEMQAWRGTYWQTFGTIRPHRNGSFSFPYRFTRTAGLQRYRLRAHVAGQPGFPYVGGSSSGVVIVVKG